MLQVPFAPPRIDQKSIDAVTETLKSGWITTGPKTKEFEKEIAKYCNVPKALCLNSATAGLELALRWFGVGPGDEVILPAYTYSATANVVIHCGAKVVFVDVDDDFNIELESIRKALSINTKVIIPVDFGGLTCDYNAINKLVDYTEVRNMFQPNNPVQEKLGRIMVLADSAHSFGADYKGEKSGSLTDISVFSFHAVKNLTTAEGGAICFNLPKPFDIEEIYELLCIKSLHGQSKDAWSKTEPGQWRYDILEPGFKCNMTDIQAALGLVELARYDKETLPKRREIFNFYDAAFKDDSTFIRPLHLSKDKSSSCHIYALRIKGISENERDEIMKLVFENGVSVNVHFIPLPMMSYYKKQGYDIKDYPNTYRNYACEISLPVFYDMTKEQMKRVVETVQAAVKEIKK
jgi:dTDP-4-amino-4,6-dideoxygalactose transaminase